MSKETIPGTYSLVKMPDGSEVMMHKLADGQWVTTAERARSDTTEFMGRFIGTDFVPAEHAPQTKGALRGPAEPGAHTQTRNRIEAYLVEILGDPALILYSDPLAMTRARAVKARPQEMRHVLGLITILNHPEWNKVGVVLQGPLQ